MPDRTAATARARASLGLGFRRSAPGMPRNRASSRTAKMSSPSAERHFCRLSVGAPEPMSQDLLRVGATIRNRGREPVSRITRRVAVDRSRSQASAVRFIASTAIGFSSRAHTRRTNRRVKACYARF
jgi:hypothetical protein